MLSGRPVTTTDYRTSQTGGAPHGQFSQELRLSSQFDGPFNFIFGGFYLNARTSGYVDTWTPANLTRGAVSKFDTRLGQVKSYAVFGEAYFDITPTLKLTGGLRYTEDKKHIETASGTFVLGPYFIGDEKIRQGHWPRHRQLESRPVLHCRHKCLSVLLAGI